MVRRRCGGAFSMQRYGVFAEFPNCAIICLCAAARRGIRVVRCCPLQHTCARRRAKAKSAAAGAAINSESMRSSTPPWPGMRLPESLTLAARFIIDSKRSPAVDARQMMMPKVAHVRNSLWAKAEAYTAPASMQNAIPPQNLLGFSWGIDVCTRDGVQGPSPRDMLPCR